jgi:hypothetical protein
MEPLADGKDVEPSAIIRVHSFKERLCAPAVHHPSTVGGGGRQRETESILEKGRPRSPM